MAVRYRNKGGAIVTWTPASSVREVHVGEGRYEKEFTEAEWRCGGCGASSGGDTCRIYQSPSTWRGTGPDRDDAARHASWCTAL